MVRSLSIRIIKMKLQYSKEHIFKGLLLAPLPLLLFSAIVFIIANHQFSLYEIAVAFFGHSLAYIAYCILTIPFSFVISLFLSYSNALNLLTICIFSMLFSTLFFLLLGWAHTGNITVQWWESFYNPLSICITLIPGICYWFFLKILTGK